ncbi:hypothetical protein EsH8_VI_000257 [Colletotrichum jinshuiense]
MRLIASLAVLAVAVNGMAIPEAEPGCDHPDQPCWEEVKREALPAPEPEAAPEANSWCIHPGQPCWKVKRAAEAFSTALSNVDGLLERSPEARLSHSEGGAAFLAKRHLDELAGVVASTQPDPFFWYSSLGLEQHFANDTTALDRREALPNAETDPWCIRPGQPCWKRDVETLEEIDIHAEDRRWCGRPGKPCWYTKRAAEALIETINEDVVKKREAEPWCIHPGQPCWKRDASPESWRATRDLDAMTSAARVVIESVA